MIASDNEFRSTIERIRKLQELVADWRGVETNPTNFRLSVGGFLAEIDRMQLEVREYLSVLPTETVAAR